MKLNSLVIAFTFDANMKLQQAMKNAFGPGSEPTKVVANVIKTDDISIIFDPIEICVRDSDWLKSLVAASP